MTGHGTLRGAGPVTAQLDLYNITKRSIEKKAAVRRPSGEADPLPRPNDCGDKFAFLSATVVGTPGS
jgi:hypothetical protein